MTLNIFCDGGARGNPGPAAIGFIVTDDHHHLLHQRGEFIGETTNNVAEYRAVLSALEWLIKNSKNWPLTTVNFFLDSVLVVNQLNGFFKIKSASLRELIIQIKILEQQFAFPVNYTAVPREKNFAADRFVNQTLDSILS